MTQNVTVVGAGRIGSVLAAKFAGAGMSVSVATRTPVATEVDGLSVRPVQEALTGADVVLLAIPGAAVTEFLERYGPALADVPVIDATNTMGGAAMHHAAEAVDLQYYRAFNTLGVENYEQPHYAEGVADLFYSGPSGDNEVVESLIRAVGLRPVYVGSGVAAADLLDGMTRLWFTLALQQGRGRHLAFRTLS